MKYLITGATGNIGSLVTKRLIAQGERPGVFVREEKKARALYGNRVLIRVGDLGAGPNHLTTAFDGVEHLFLLTSGPDLALMDRDAALAAKAAGVRHIVKLSTLDARTGVGTGPWHAQGEAAIRETGIPFTFVQTAAFMSNVLGWARLIRATSSLRSSAGNGKIAFIHPDDLAEVITRALTTRTHHGEALVVTGPEALSYAEMASQLGAVLGRNIRYEEIGDDEARKTALGFGDRRYADALVDIWRAIREGRVATVSDGVQRILGRPPISFARWAEQNAAEFR
jgi:uncharacterized protein YbjT (DUF2867 family)